MRLVIDASVAIASIRALDPAHAAARARIERAIQNIDELVHPAIFPIEVGGALARLSVPNVEISRLVDALLQPPHELVAIGVKRAGAAQTIAMKARLRGADALYVWLASTRDLTLCTLDHEMAQRGVAFCKIISP